MDPSSQRLFEQDFTRGWLLKWQISALPSQRLEIAKQAAPKRNGPDLGGAGAVNLRGFLPEYTSGGSGERRVYPQPGRIVPVALLKA
jgi:hypothetical protein